MGRPTVEVRATSLNEESMTLVGQDMQVQQDSQRIVFLHGEVTEGSIASVIAQLLHFANINREPINLVVSTYGGSVDEMFSLYDTIKFLPCPVHTIGLGKVMSAGVLLLAAGAKGHRSIGGNARIMMHSLSGGAFGNVFEMENQSKECRRLHDLMVGALARETKMSTAQVKKIMDPKVDFYVTPEKAVKLGIVDRILNPRR
jgi:ATP-dependent Clp protease protease subunit